MKKILFTVLCLVCITNLSEAKMYVCIDKKTDEVKGTVDILEKNFNEWSKNFIMVEADENYRGKKSYEIDYGNGKISLSSKGDISKKLEVINSKIKDEQRKISLDVLGLTESDINKIKGLQ